MNSTGTLYTIEEVGTNQAFQEAATSGFDGTPLGKNASIVFRSVSNSLQSLLTVQNNMQQNLSQLGSEGVIDIGVDQMNNRVDVTAKATTGSADQAPSEVPSSTLDQQLATQYGSGVMEYSSGTEAVPTSSPTSDSRPWNGGDQMASSTAPTHWECTSGFGLHLASSGADLLLTAGHCAYAVVESESPINCCEPEWDNASTLVGGESAWSAGGVSMTTPGLDEGVIPTESSDQVWDGPTSKITIDNYYLPPAGATVCEDGSVGGLKCGSLVSTGDTVEETLKPTNVNTWSEDELQVSLIEQGGDSGGAAWVVNSGSPYAVGINTGVGTVGTTMYSYMEEMSPIIYVYSVYYGTTVELNTPTNGCGGTPC